MHSRGISLLALHKGSIRIPITWVGWALELWNAEDIFLQQVCRRNGWESLVGLGIWLWGMWVCGYVVRRSEFIGNVVFDVYRGWENYDGNVDSVWRGSIWEMERIYGRQTCYFVTCSFYNCVRRGLFKYMNRWCLLFRKSLEHNRTIAYFLTPLLYSSLLPLLLFATPLSPHLESFTEYLTSVNPPVFFSHVLTGRGRNRARRALVIYNSE